MKKVLLLFLSLVLVLSFAACRGENQGSTDTSQTSNQNLEGSLESILEKLYENADVDDTFKDFIENGLMTTEITEENCEYHLGKEDIEYEEAIASEPIMMPSAYSLCLVRVKEGADVDKIKSEIKENVDPMKWVCVGVDPQNIIVDNIGDVIVLIMSDDYAQALHEAFLSLKG